MRRNGEAGIRAVASNANDKVESRSLEQRSRYSFTLYARLSRFITTDVEIIAFLSSSFLFSPLLSLPAE